MFQKQDQRKRDLARGKIGTQRLSGGVLCPKQVQTIVVDLISRTDGQAVIPRTFAACGSRRGEPLLVATAKSSAVFISSIFR